MDGVEGPAVVTGTPQVRAVPEWVAPSLREVAWMEHALLWVYVGRGKSPEVHGARCALAWLGAVYDDTPVTAEVVAPTRLRTLGELLVCGALAAGDPYPEPQWWRENGLAVLDTADRRQWWEGWIRWGWNQAVARGSALALGWAVGHIEDEVPVVPRHDAEGSRVPVDVRDECRAAIREAMARPLPPLVERARALSCARRHVEAHRQDWAAG